MVEKKEIEEARQFLRLQGEDVEALEREHEEMVERLKKIKERAHLAPTVIIGGPAFEVGK